MSGEDIETKAIEIKEKLLFQKTIYLQLKENNYRSLKLQLDL
jgi:hypothetical protein